MLIFNDINRIIKKLIRRRTEKVKINAYLSSELLIKISSNLVIARFYLIKLLNDNHFLKNAFEAWE